MNQIFMTILSMSITAGFVALVVIFARLALKRSPKIFSYVLWAAVLFRMLSPVAFESSIGLWRSRPAPLLNEATVVTSPDNFFSGYTISITNDFATRDVMIISTEAAPNVGVGVGVDFMQAFINAASFVWLFGIAVLLGYAAVSYVGVKRRVFAAVRVRENIYESDRVSSPFVIGFIKPRIIIPAGLDPSEADYIIRHEQTHLRRGDHFIKLLAFAGLALHWFNPIIWVSYFLMSRDMELSCDESVMRKAETDIRCNYSSSLLRMSVRQSGLPNPLPFGESSVKARVKNVLGFKKCPRFIAVLSSIFAVAVIGVSVVNGASPVSNEILPALESSAAHNESFHFYVTGWEPSAGNNEQLRFYAAGMKSAAEHDGTVFLRVNASSRQAVECLLSSFLSGYNLEHHHEGRFYPSDNRVIWNLFGQHSTVTVEYMRPRPTWHTISSFVRFDTAPGEVSPHMDILLESIPQTDNGGVPWLIASYRADTWEIHALYGFSDGEHRLEQIVTSPQLFFSE